MIDARPSAAATILIIEDDHILNDQINALLNARGFHSCQCFTGREGLDMALSNTFDLILLDVRLPELDGFSVLSHLRGTRETPVMILSACGAEEERITGYSNGADDYLPKPFNVVELMLRIQAILRRTKGVVAAEMLSAADTLADERLFTLDLHTGRVCSGAAEVLLTPVEARILHALLASTGEVLSKPSLYRNVLHREFSRFDRSLDMHVSRIRRKLKKAGMDASRIETAHGEGYLVR